MTDTESVAEKRAEHTRGPWATEDTTLGVCRLIISVEELPCVEIHPTAEENRVVAYVPIDYAEKEQRANARLIAAAPDLLDALKGLRIRDECFCDMAIGHPLMRSHSDVCIAARAAITKAEGR